MKSLKMKVVFHLENEKKFDHNYAIWERILHEERFPTPASEPIAKHETTTKSNYDYAILKDHITEKCSYFGKCDKRTCGICTATACNYKKYVVRRF